MLTGYDTLARRPWQNLKKWQETQLGTKSDNGACPNNIPFGIPYLCITKTKIV
jgi:hypothetical protein